MAGFIKDADVRNQGHNWNLLAKMVVSAAADLIPPFRLLKEMGASVTLIHIFSALTSRPSSSSPVDVAEGLLT